MAEIYLIDMSYGKAIDILENSDNYGNSKEDIQLVASAIHKMLNMTTINAVSKLALINAVEWLYNRAFEERYDDNG